MIASASTKTAGSMRLATKPPSFSGGGLRTSPERGPAPCASEPAPRPLIAVAFDPFGCVTEGDGGCGC